HHPSSTTCSLTHNPNPRKHPIPPTHPRRTSVHTRTWRATDACGNHAECSQKVTVQDTTNPTIACAGDKSVECASPWTFDEPTAIVTFASDCITISCTTSMTSGPWCNN